MPAASMVTPACFTNVRRSISFFASSGMASTPGIRFLFWARIAEDFLI
jgi:hypothetical protein